MIVAHLARVLRPHRFADMVGQEVQVQLVQKALITGLRPVVVIFGPSGVGKTTLARIIALYQCCTNHVLNEPCGACQNCVSILQDTHPDVIELDGGTYTSVEHIKSILSTVQYATTGYNLQNRRVYIIDEVHMISRHAITALLKEFEKELPNTQFILATTNIDKLPSAIVSRALPIRLDPIPDDKMSTRLKEVVSESGYTIDEASVESIVYGAYGSMRQALSLLEQVSVLSKEITGMVTESVLGLVPSNAIEQLLDVFEVGDINKLFKIIGEVKKNLDPEMITSQLLNRISKKIQKNQASDRLIQIGYELADASIMLHNLPYSHNLLEIIFGTILIRYRPEEPASKPRLSDLARKLFE
jgi:DNA polymerase-3 subunit gamma/tau